MLPPPCLWPGYPGSRLRFPRSEALANGRPGSRRRTGDRPTARSHRPCDGTASSAFGVDRTGLPGAAELARRSLVAPSASSRRGAP